MNLRAFASCLLCLVAPSAAAETFYTCDTIITTLPTTISTQGVYCLNSDLLTAQTSGNAITIATNNVVLDCNGYRIGGLSGGTATDAYGVRATNRQNITVRQCSIRGFRYGVALDGTSANSVVEHNRLEQNRAIGIWVNGSSHTVRHNQINDTGGRPASSASAIRAGGDLHDISDNNIYRVWATGTTPVDGQATGIGLNSSAGSVIRGNRISRLLRGGSASAYGIDAFGAQVSVEGNHLALINSASPAAGYGIYGDAKTACRDNVVSGWTTALNACAVSLDNLVDPP